MCHDAISCFQYFQKNSLMQFIHANILFKCWYLPGEMTMNCSRIVHEREVSLEYYLDFVRYPKFKLFDYIISVYCNIPSNIE